MNEDAYRAIEEAWERTVKIRALCPIMSDSPVERTEYASPEWYQARGASYFVKPVRPLTATDIEQLRQIGNFVNHSFIISMVAILEEFHIVPYHQNPDRSRPGGNHVQLAKWLRNRFAHGGWQYNPGDQYHKETRELLEELFPTPASGNPGFVTSIDGVLEPLKDGVLTYIRASS